MSKIIIQSSHRDDKGWTFQVELMEDSDAAKTYTVRLDEDFYQKLTGGKVSAEDLIEESFKFLMEREDPSSILSNFDLDIIATYFDDYEDKILSQIESVSE